MTDASGAGSDPTVISFASADRDTNSGLGDMLTLGLRMHSHLPGGKPHWGRSMAR
jgi:hypothetical protein